MGLGLYFCNLQGFLEKVNFFKTMKDENICYNDDVPKPEAVVLCLLSLSNLYRLQKKLFHQWNNFTCDKCASAKASLRLFWPSGGAFRVIYYANSLQTHAGQLGSDTRLCKEWAIKCLSFPVIGRRRFPGSSFFCFKMCDVLLKTEEL